MPIHIYNTNECACRLHLIKRKCIPSNQFSHRILSLGSTNHFVPSHLLGHISLSLRYLEFIHFHKRAMARYRLKYIYSAGIFSIYRIYRIIIEEIHRREYIEILTDPKPLSTCFLVLFFQPNILWNRHCFRETTSRNGKLRMENLQMECPMRIQQSLRFSVRLHSPFTVDHSRGIWICGKKGAEKRFSSDRRYRGSIF